MTAAARDTIREIMGLRNINENTLCTITRIDPNRFQLIMDGLTYLTKDEAKQLEVFGIAPADWLLRQDARYIAEERKGLS